MNLIRHLHSAQRSGRLPASPALATVPQRLHQAQRYQMLTDGQNRWPRRS